MITYRTVDGPESFLDVLNELAENNQIRVQFSGWPNFGIEIEGERYNGSMTPKLMQGFIEFHTHLLRAYALTRHGSQSLSRISATDKAELDLVFYISEGCTEGKAELDGLLNKLLGALPMHKMSGMQVTLILLVVTLSIAGYFTFDRWLGHEKEAAYIDALSETSAANAELARRLVKTLADQSAPESAKQIHQYASDGYRAIVRNAPDAESISIQGRDYDRQDLDRISDGTPSRLSRSERKDVVYVTGLKHLDDEILSLTLRLKDGVQEFTSKLHAKHMSTDKKNKVFDALKNTGNQVLVITHRTTQDGDTISSSLILDVD